MPGIIQVTIRPPFRDIAGRFAKANKELIDDQREMMRRLGQKWVVLAREEAPKRTGEFARSIIYRTYIRGETVQLYTYSKQPLGGWIVRGTDAHPIAARTAGALYFFWPKVGMYTVVPKSGGFRTHVSGGKLWIGKGHVDHPGTKPNPYHERAYARWKPDARPELRRIALRYVAVIQG